MTFESILGLQASRRAVLRWGGLASLLAGVSLLPLNTKAQRALLEADFVDFASVPHALTQGHALATGYQAEVIARWGDPLFATEEDFDPARLNAESQKKRFGYNNDFLAYLPFPRGSADSNHGLLHVNHEYTDARLMFPSEQGNARFGIEMAAHGFSVLEIKRDTAGWQQAIGSEFSRRVTATTPIRISGPAAGHARLRTLKDPQGKMVLGTLANCAGGVTPWGTVLVSEENFDGYFFGRTVGEEAHNHQRYTVGKDNLYGWYKIDPRFAVAREPNEPNRFGWIVEYDPYDPKSPPVKRTALGRFKHETATCAVTADGRLAVYSGDDDYFEYLYRFVSKEKIASGNRDLLDAGELQVAKFDADGTLAWIPLVHGQHGLTAANGFHDQGDVLIEARRAGDVVGATKMDRPEGIAIHPRSQEVYLSLTKNPKRIDTDAANPRPRNKAGHILVLKPPSGDHAAQRYQWSIFVLAGNPEEDKPRYGRRPKKDDWFSCPDNLAMDPSGRLWVATDGMPESHQLADGLYALATEGNQEAAPRCFFRAPKGAEATGPCFTPDGETLFLSVQHPAEGSSYASPSTRWPDFQNHMPPRPAVLAFTRKGGGKIGG